MKMNVTNFSAQFVLLINSTEYRVAGWLGWLKCELLFVAYINLVGFVQCTNIFGSNVVR